MIDKEWAKREKQKNRERTKLKTLKDLKPILMMFGNEESIVYEIKKEAINWVKKEIKINHGFIMPSNERWMKRLNITEEDLTELKGGKKDGKNKI